MADLRYWDGQTWTQQTAATPVALAAATMPPPAIPQQPMPYQPIPQQSIPHQPIPHQPIPQQPSAPMGGQPYPLTRALPGSLAGGSSHSGAAHRRSGVRVGNFYALIAAGVAVAVAAAVAIPLALHKSGHKHPTLSANQPITAYSPAPQPSAAPSPLVTPANPAAPKGTAASSYHLPAAFAGYPRITDSRAAENEAEVMSTWTLTGPRVFGVYGGPTGDPTAMALLQSFALPPAEEAQFVKGAEESVSSGVPGMVWQPTSTGSYGGVMQCGSTTAGKGGSVCVFADRTTVGLTFFVGDPVTGQVKAADLRAVSEPAPSI